MTKIRTGEKIVLLLKKKKLTEWTVSDLAETGLSKGVIASCHYIMKQAGKIVDTGRAAGNKKIWAWPPPTHPEPTHHVIGEQIIGILRQQDKQIAADTVTINDLSHQISNLKEKNTQLTERINVLTNGRVTTKELSEMNRRSTLQ